MTPRLMWERVRGSLAGPLTFTKLLDIGLWIALPYTVIGVIYAGLHIELMGLIEDALSSKMTFLAVHAALLVTVACWPILLASSLMCGAAGCGVF
jgi:hypothetical protein